MGTLEAMSLCFLTAKAHPGPSARLGRGIICTAEIAPGEVVAAFGGRCLTPDEFLLLPREQQRRSIQIEDELYLAGGPEPEPADFINHSCDPNCGLSGGTVLVARRPIHPQEELTFDFATVNASDFDEFDCGCGTARCRGRVTGQDWMLPDLQVRHRGFFSPYLARRIAALHRVGAERRAFAL